MHRDVECHHQNASNCCAPNWHRDEVGRGQQLLARVKLARAKLE